MFMKLLSSLGGIFLLLIQAAYGQQGGKYVYTQLDVPVSSHQSALGGSLVSIRDGDLSLCLQNPSLLDSSAHNKLVLGYTDYVNTINQAFAGYARHFDKVGTFMASLQYLNYGEFEYTDAIGNRLGFFRASDYALNIGYSIKYDSCFFFGANVRMFASQYDKYSAFAIASDLAAGYYRKSAEFSATVILKNIGTELKTLSGGPKNPLPFQAMLALSKKLKHAPFRFHVAYEHLTRWDLTYLDPTIKPEIDPTTGNEIPIEEPGNINKFLRHLVPGAEILIGKNFYFDFGFHFRRREENKYSEKPGATGLNFGFGMRIRKFNVGYSFSKYHIAAPANQVTIGVRLSDFATKK